MKMLELMGITGIKKVIRVILVLSSIAYLCGRLFYVPNRYCYVDKVGYITEDLCVAHYKHIERQELTKKATKESLDMIDLWYYQLYTELKNEESRNSP